MKLIAVAACCSLLVFSQEKKAAEPTKQLDRGATNRSVFDPAKSERKKSAPNKHYVPSTREKKTASTRRDSRRPAILLDTHPGLNRGGVVEYTADALRRA